MDKHEFGEEMAYLVDCNGFLMPASRQVGSMFTSPFLSVSGDEIAPRKKKLQVWKKKAKNLLVGCFLLTREPMLSVVRKNPEKG